MSENQHNKAGKPFLIVIVAVAIVAIVSLIPIAKLTGGKFSDFNLLSDLFGIDDTTVVAESSMPVDPALLEMQTQMENQLSQDTLDKKNSSLSIGDKTASSSSESISGELSTGYDSLGIAAPKVAKMDADGFVAIEDYSVDNRGLSRIKKALAEGRLARIAILGDSYIEGDIFSQDVRALLQSQYGGGGVGYMNMHSDFPGFRQSISQSSSGWTAHLAGKKETQSKYIGISESYFTSGGSAWSQYKGTKKVANADSWNRSKFLFVAPTGGEVTLKAGDREESFDLEESADVQCLSLDVPTSEFKVSVSGPSVIGLGVWLDKASGISVDCMSARGFSGITLSKVSADLCRQMARYVNYDLIILEYGINAMTSTQKDYSFYRDQMIKVINHLRQCYPNADFLLMGVGDRGEKRGGEIHSMISVSNMIDYQRQAARTAHCLFWDTREAMGGEDAVAEWSSHGLINKDYIHMTHKGGARLAKSFVESFKKLLQ